MNTKDYIKRREKMYRAAIDKEKTIQQNYNEIKKDQQRERTELLEREKEISETIEKELPQILEAALSELLE